MQIAVTSGTVVYERDEVSVLSIQSGCALREIYYLFFRSKAWRCHWRSLTICYPVTRVLGLVVGYYIYIYMCTQCQDYVYDLVYKLMR